jgi:hypothetical protein
VQIRWARSARRHRVSRARIVHVIEHCGLVFVAEPPAGAPAGVTERLVYLGDDAEGRPLEVMAVRLEEGGILVIHAMALRQKYRAEYEEAKRWRV